MSFLAELEDQCFWVKNDVWDLIECHSPSSCPLPMDSILSVDDMNIRIFLLTYHGFLQLAVSNGNVAIEDVLECKIDGNPDIGEEQMTLFEFALITNNILVLEFMETHGYPIVELEPKTILMAIASASQNVVDWMIDRGFGFSWENQEQSCLCCPINNRVSIDFFEFLVNRGLRPTADDFRMIENEIENGWENGNEVLSLLREI